MKARFMSESETTSDRNWKVIKDKEGKVYAGIKLLSLWTSWHFKGKTRNWTKRKWLDINENIP